MHDEERWAQRPLSAFQQRSRRYSLAQWRADHAKLLGSGSAAICMRPAAPLVGVHIGADGAIGKSGVMRCSHSTLCPVCAPGVRTTRAGDINALVEAAQGVGLQAWFVTVTIPHSKSDELGSTLSVLTDAWRDMLRNGTGQRWKTRAGYKGLVRSVEVTWGKNGWHPHIHAVVVCEDLDPLDLVSMWRARWASLGILDQWVPRKAIDIRQVTGGVLGDYLGKVNMAWGMGQELARADLKAGRSLNPAQLLELAATGEARWVRRWEELERFTKGLHWIQWSPRLRCKAAGWQIDMENAGGTITGVSLGEPELSDDEAALGLVESPVAVFAVPAPVWTSFRASGRLGALINLLVCCQAETIGAYRVGLDWRPEHDVGPLALSTA